ncbi:MAG TPA: hypothetical protein VGC10_01360 [Sphingomonas sp.]
MLVHIPIAIAVQLICWAIGHALAAPRRASLWIGCWAGSAVCVMREVTQAEYRWIDAYGHGLRANMPPLAGWAVWQWNRHSIDETWVAILASAAFAAALTWRRDHR